MDLLMYILVVLAYNTNSGVCIRTEDPRKYRDSELPTSRQNLQIRMKELINLAIIRADCYTDILRRLGITDPPQRTISSPLHRSTESPQRSHGIPFKPLGITRILSGSPDTQADTNML
ncbi:uncharacterized protein LOC128228677 [Mya arenaria]|nr:uncharacterized protein LOC128228677 [Mya arenaria]